MARRRYHQQQHPDGYQLPEADKKAVRDTAARMGIRASELLAIILYESKGNPHVVNSKGYYGLIQFSPELQAKWNIRGKNFAQQMPLVERYFRESFKHAKLPLNNKTTFAHLYAAVLTGSPRGSVHAKDSNNTSVSSALPVLEVLKRTAERILGTAVDTTVAVGRGVVNVGKAVVDAGRDVTTTLFNGITRPQPAPHRQRGATPRPIRAPQPNREPNKYHPTNPQFANNTREPPSWLIDRPNNNH